MNIPVKLMPARRSPCLPQTGLTGGLALILILNLLPVFGSVKNLTIKPELISLYEGHYIGEVVPTPKKARYQNSFLTLWDIASRRAQACLLLKENASHWERLAAAELSAQVGYLAAGRKISQVSERDLLLPILTKPSEAQNYPVIIVIGTKTKSILLAQMSQAYGIKLPTDLKPEGYAIRVGKARKGICLLCAGADELGTYYGVQSLLQLMKVKNGKVMLREAEITDYPDFKIRAHQYDGEFPNETQAHFSLNWMAKLKLNQLGFGQAYDMPMEWRALSEEHARRLRLLCGLAKDRGTVQVLFYPHPHRSDPKFNIRISDPKDLEALVNLCKTALEAGAGGIMLRSDDIYPLAEEDKRKFGDQGSAHSHLIIQLYKRLKADRQEFKFLFCPPYYIGNWVKREPAAQAYLRKLGQSIPKEVIVIWTGPVTRSLEIKVEDLKYFSQVLGRTPFLWDNTVYAHRSRYGYDPGHTHYLMDTFATRYPANFHNQTLGITYNWNISSQISLVGGINTADFLWNSSAYQPEKSLRKALAIVAGEENIENLLRFRESFYEIFDAVTGGRVADNLPRILKADKDLQTAFNQLKKQCDNQALIQELQSSLRWTQGQIEKIKKTAELIKAAQGKILVDLRFDRGIWRTATEGKWNCKKLEGAAEISFPAQTRSFPGAYGQFSTDSKVPPSPTGKYYFLFSVTDDYKASGTPPRAWPGYLFKQVLIDNLVIWEDDVEGEEPEDQEMVQIVDISDIARGKNKLRISFRGLDRRGVGNMGVKIRFTSPFISAGPFILKHQYINMPDAPCLSPTDEMTVTARISPAVIGRRQAIYSKSNPWQYFAYIHETGSINAGIFIAGKEYGISSQTKLEPNKIYHFAFTYDGKEMRIYINGELEAKKELNGQIDQGNGNLNLGSYFASEQLFEGRIEEVKLFNRALSEDEITKEAKGISEIASITENIALNPSAEALNEAGKPIGWGCYIGEGKAEWGTEEPGHNGKRCAFLRTIDFQPEGPQKGRLNVALMQGDTDGYTGTKAYKALPNNSYQVSFWLKGDVPKIAFEVLGWKSEEGKPEDRISLSTTLAGNIWLTGDWKFYQGTFTTTPETKRFALRFSIQGQENAKESWLGKLCVDDVKIKPLPAGLVGWWRPSEPGSTLATDYSGAANHGSIYRRWRVP